MATQLVQTLPTLTDAIVSARRAWDGIEEAARTFDRSTMADRLWIGVTLLIAQEHHAMDASARGKRGGRGRKSILSLDNLSPDQPHPQGFFEWVKANMPWLPRRTAYKYMDAARGAGFTAWASETEVRQWVADQLEANPDLTLKALVDTSRELLSSKDEDADPDSERNITQLTFEALLGFRDQCEVILSHREHMDQRQREIACARAYKLLRELTGQPWAPADRDYDEFIAVLEDATAAGF